MKYLVLKVLPIQDNKDSIDYRTRILQTLQDAINDRQSIPELVDTIRGWVSTEPFRYRQWIQMHLKAVPVTMDELVRRMSILKLLNESEDESVLALEDEYYKVLEDVFITDKTFKWPADEACVTFFQDLKAANDQTTPPLREIKAKDLKA